MGAAHVTCGFGAVIANTQVWCAKAVFVARERLIRLRFAVRERGLPGFKASRRLLLFAIRAEYPGEGAPSVHVQVV